VSDKLQLSQRNDKLKLIGHQIPTTRCLHVGLLPFVAHSVDVSATMDDRALKRKGSRRRLGIVISDDIGRWRERIDERARNR